MYTKQIIKNIYNPRAGTVKYVLSGFLFIMAMIAQIDVQAQASCVANFSVVTSPPTMGSNGGDFTINASDLNDGSTGVLVGVSFSAASYTSTTLTGVCSNYPTGEVEVFLFTNDGGAETSCSTIVELIDTGSPVIECFGSPDIPLDPVTGSVTITTDMLGEVYENCNLATFEISGGDPTYYCGVAFGGGGPSLTLIASDAAGNTASTFCSFTLVDVTPPTANCVTALDYYTSRFNYTLPNLNNYEVDDNSSDNCGIDSRSLSQNTFDCNEVGTIVPVTLTVTDIAGNTDQCVCMVSVIDDVDPELNFSSFPFVSLDENGSHTLSGDDVTNSALTFDDCSEFEDLTWSFDVPTFDCDDVGTYVEVIATVTDENFNSETGTVDVYVFDFIAPEAMCKTTVELELDANGNALLTSSMVDDGSVDNCSIDNWSLSHTAFNCSDIGTTTTVTLTVTDQSGSTGMNSDFCTSEITVVDNLPPTVMCKDTTIDYNTSIIPGDVTALITDNCSVASTVLSQTDFECIDLGVQSVTVTVTDVNGNSSSCIAMVTVQDTFPPVAIAMNIAVELNASGMITINPFDANNGSYDDCDNSLNFSVSPPTFSCDDLGSQTATLIVTDDSGNSDSAAFTVFVEDDMDPTVTCQAQTAMIDATGMVTVDAIDFVSVSDDNCMVKDTMISFTEIGGYTSNLSFYCSDVSSSPIEIWVRVRDYENNKAKCNTTLTLEAAEMPVAEAMDLTIELDASGMKSITHAEVDAGSTGLCGVSVSLSKYDFTCDDIGTESITLTAMDAFGNMADATAMITIEDNFDPVLTTNALNAVFESDGTYTLDLADMATYTDNCEGATLVASKTNFTCSDAGPNMITFTVTDAGGNSVMESKTLTILDDESPSFTCKDEIIVNLDPVTGEASFVEDIENEHVQDFTFTGTAPINMPIIDVPVDVLAPSCPNNSSLVGAKMLFCTNTDNSFFTENIEFTFTHPTEGTVQSVIVGSSGFGNDCQEFCEEILIPSSDLVSVSGSMIGSITAKVAGSGIDDFCTEDNVRIAYSLRYIDNMEIFDVPPSDNCSSECELIVSLTQMDYDCNDYSDFSTIGPLSLDISVTDAAGNTSSLCTTDIVVDNPPKVLALEPGLIPIQMLDGLGSYTLDPNLIDAGSDAACEGGTLTVSPSTFDCSNLGENTVTLRYETADGDYDEETTVITLVTDPLYPDPCNLCPEFVTMHNNPIFNGQYNASNSIQSEGKITGDANSNEVDFNATMIITLQPGFSVDKNSNFNAVIKECDN